MVSQADMSNMITCLDVICSRLAWVQTVQTEVSSVVPGYFQIHLVSLAHDLTGHKTGLSVLLWMTLSCFSSFFCILNIMTTLSANSKSSDGAGRRCTFLKNLMFCRQRSCVLFISLLGTFTYSQERQVKKAALIVSCATALSNSVTCLLASSSSTTKSRAFCCLNSRTSLCWKQVFHQIHGVPKV
jgi:hypothetical protein